MLRRIFLFCTIAGLLCMVSAGEQEIPKEGTPAIEAKATRLPKEKPPGQRRELGVVVQRHSDRGFLVRQVLPGSVAEKAGIRPGDAIISHGEHVFLGRNLPVEQLGKAVRAAPAGKPVIVVVVRNDKTVSMNVVYGGARRPPLALSPQQKKLVAQFGYPDTFVISCYSENEKGKTKDIRQETWFYYHLLTNFSFINGEFSASEPIEKLPDDLVYPRYKPERFRAGMSLAEVKTLLGDTKGSPLNVKDLDVGDESLEQAQLYFAGHVSMVFVEDALCYVLTTPGDPEPTGKEVAK